MSNDVSLVSPITSAPSSPVVLATCNAASNTGITSKTATTAPVPTSTAVRANVFSV